MRSPENIETVKRSTFQMRMNPEQKQQMENICGGYGLTLTDAFNIFVQQTIREQGFPFLLSPENLEYKRAKAMRHLMAEVEKGWRSAEEEGWLSLEEVEAQLGIAHE